MTEKLYSYTPPDSSIGPFLGIPVFHSPYLDRETIIVSTDPAFRGESSKVLFLVGTNLVRGVAYTVEGLVERGYLLDNPTSTTARLIDATTGRLVTINQDQASRLDGKAEGPALFERLK